MSEHGYSEKVLELQEAIQHFQLLKQMGGADKLVRRQEKEILTLQAELIAINEKMPVDIMEEFLPKKCQYCTLKTRDDERLECYEELGEKCNRKAPVVNLANSAMLKFVLSYVGILLVLLTFLLFTNIFEKYIDLRWLQFTLSFAGLIGVVALFFKPFKKLLAMFG